MTICYALQFVLYVLNFQNVQCVTYLYDMLRITICIICFEFLRNVQCVTYLQNMLRILAGWLMLASWLTLARLGVRS